MKMKSKQSKVSIRGILCVSILIFGISIFSAMRVNATNISYDPPTYSSLTPHAPISITSDLGFDFFPGSGESSNPYIIEGYNITTTDDNGIYISSTTKHFIVRNCYVDALYVGINIDNVASGTATIINNTCTNNWHSIMIFDTVISTVTDNTCENNNYYGILLLSSGSSMVANNTCNNNENGIYLSSSGSSMVANNNCNNNENGIYLSSSGSLTVANNTCNSNGDMGISLASSGDSTVANNTCNNSTFEGIFLVFSDYSTVENNICNNNDNGILFDSSDFCNITYNLLQENIRYGVFSVSGSDNCAIHHNTFDDNNPTGTSQALDDGTNNIWYDTVALEGNYWSDWSGTGSYSIDGVANSVDLYPLDKPTVDIELPFIVDIIHSPSTPTELDTISINTNVTDTSGIQSVALHYRINSGTWTDVSMTLISVDIYSVTIGPFAVGDTIEYYVSAVDNSANHNEAFTNFAGFYYSFTVVEVISEFLMCSPLLPTIAFLSLGFCLVVLQRRKK